MNRERGPARPIDRPAPREAGAAPTVAALAVAIVLLIASGVVAATQVDDQAAGSPQEAVERLLAAAAGEDLLGVLEALVPAERASFQGSLRDLAGELRRLELASRSFSLGDIGGIDLDFRDLRFSTEEVRPDLAVVWLVGGTARAEVDPSRLPLGPFAEDAFGAEVSRARPSGSETQLGRNPDDGGFATLKVGDSWYVSLWYSVAEAARREAGLPLPDLDRRLQPRGADSPEGAGEAFVRNLFGFDFAGLIAQFPPGEARALHDYAPLFVSDLRRGTASIRSQVDVQLRRVEVEAKPTSRGALVKITDVAFIATIPRLRLVVTVADDCVEVRELGSTAVERVCAGDEGLGALGSLVPDVDLPELTLETPELGLVAVREEGAWYISPTRTVLDNITAMLRVFDLGDLEALRRFAESFPN